MEQARLSLFVVVELDHHFCSLFHMPYNPWCLDQQTHQLGGEIQVIVSTSSEILLQPAGLSNISSLRAGETRSFVGVLQRPHFRCHLAINFLKYIYTVFYESIPQFIFCMSFFKERRISIWLESYFIVLLFEFGHTCMFI